MNLKLELILKKHLLYLNGDTEKGEKANLRLADLSEADLSFIKGKEIFMYNGSQHTAIMIDGNVKIGCKEFSVEYWLKNGELIGKANGYSEIEISQYLNWIRKMS